MSANPENIEQELLKCLKYFDYFHFPLRIDELERYLSIPTDQTQLVNALNHLKKTAKIFEIDGAYGLSGNREVYSRKINGFALANQKMQEAQKTAAFIFQFPFVEMVSISGSLSKEYADESSDIDFFIVTKAGRLWVARSLLHFFKKMTFIVGKQHNFCMNYFLSLEKVKIEEENYYTAIELTTLKPVYGAKVYETLIAANKDWLLSFVPNYEKADNTLFLSQKSKKNGLKRIAEFILNSRGLDRFFMQLTDNWWRKKWKKKGYPMEDYDLAFKTNSYVSKNHPSNYQKKVLEHYDKA